MSFKKNAFLWKSNSSETPLVSTSGDIASVNDGVVQLMSSESPSTFTSFLCTQSDSVIDHYSSNSSDADISTLSIEVDEDKSRIVCNTPQVLDFNSATPSSNWSNDTTPSSSESPSCQNTNISPLYSSLDTHSSKSILKSQSREKPVGICKVCGDVATGKYFGALVCVPCKTFFLRYAGEGFSFICKGKKNCEISVSTRIQCKYCRYKKCIEAGMQRKLRPLQVEPKEGKQLCVVCSDLGNGVHFGAVTCEGCKKFFRRGLVEHKSYICKYDKRCPINPQTRNTCRYCRYNKCKNLGMSREAIQMGRPSKVSQKQASKPMEEQGTETDESMDTDKPAYEGLGMPQALDLTVQISPQQLVSTGAISLGNKKQVPISISESVPQFASLPPSFQINTCLLRNEIPILESSVPSFQLNKNQKIVFKSNKHENDQNQSNPGLGQNLSKRITMSDLVATFGSSKLNAEDCDRSDLWVNEICRSDSLRKIHTIREEGSSIACVLASEESLYADVSCDVGGNAEDATIEHKIKFLLGVSERYWSTSLSPDENLLISDDRHLDMINRIVPNYGEFVTSNETINHNLTTKYREWASKRGNNMNFASVSDWIKIAVIPAFTIISVKYCKKIPGFKNFDIADQVKIACLGQSPSRILAAVLHWFDSVTNDFRDFMSWRDRIPGNSDRFKQYLINFANKAQLLQLDPIEAALLNSLVIVAADYPDLVNNQAIETARVQIISTFRAYIAAKYGTASDRLDKLFGIIPEIRKIGFFHHEMANRKTMMVEEFGEHLLASLNL